ncbi:MAG: hypothetical protein RLZZ156_2529, partial [Deinococcota bacterium]
MSPRAASTGTLESKPATSVLPHSIAKSRTIGSANSVVNPSNTAFLTPLDVILEQIPNELKQLNRWVVWKLTPRQNGKPTKIPFVATNPKIKASINDPTTWATYNEAGDSYNSGGFSGIGFVLVATDDICGIDIDNCRDPGTGNLTETATNCLKTAQSYSEVSPSGTGIRILLRGTLSGTRR